MEARYRHSSRHRDHYTEKEAGRIHYSDDRDGPSVREGLLTRTSIDKKTYLYHVALSRQEFLARESRKMVDSMVADFGDLALTQFLEAIEQADPRHIEQLRKIWEESGRQADNQEAED